MNARGQDLTDADLSSPIARQAIELLKECGNCAQTSFAILNEAHGLEGGPVLRALTPLPGIALRGETCGAVIGSLMALGLVYGRDNLRDWNAYILSLPPARKFCARFVERFGSTTCCAILEHELGQTFDLADKAEALHYAVAGGPEACANVVAYAVELASEGIQEGKQRAS